MIQIHDHGKIIEVEPSDKSQLTRGIMRSSELLLSFRSDVALDIHLGATVDFEGETFTLYYPSEVKKLWRGYFDYTITFHSSAELLKQRLLKAPSDPGRTAFTFTGSAHDFATLIARSMGEGWSVGDCMVSDGDRMIAFREETCLGALARIAEDFHSEWVVERQTIAIRKQELWRDDPVAMSYGRGKGFLSGVSRSGDGDKLPISRLYVLGGSRNIDPAAYGSRSLHLPDGSTALSSGVEGREAALDLSHIYPSRVGTVSEVVTVDEAKCFYDIKDDSIPAELNYSDCRIPGEKAVIRFQSGALAGRELEIRQSETAIEGYHHEERRFELVPREEDGFTFPSTRWMPKAGDKYAVFGISLPPTYVKEAEERMLSEAKRYLSDNMEPVYTFRGEVDGIWARKHWLEVGGKLVPGGHVLFSDPEFHPSGSVIRIVSTTQAVNDPHAPSVTLSTAPVPGSFLSRLDRVEADEVVRREQIREVQRQQSQSYRQALEHLSMVDRAVEGLEGFTRRLKPSVIETMGILVGSQATQLDFVRAVGSLESVTPAINFDPEDKALHVGESVLRHQTIGITTMRDKRDPSEYRYWRLPEYVSPPLTDPDRSYYIYARAARVGTEGAFLLSEEPIPMESDPDYYHLLIGTLSSLDNGDRAYNRLYGFSMISPGQMVVDTISSANGRMSIDLAQGEIYASSVSFSRPDGARGSLADLAGEVDELQCHPPKIVDGKWHVWDGKAQTYVNTGDDARGETGKNGLSPKIVDGKWSVWDGTRWVSTGVPARGPEGEQGTPGKDGAPGHSLTSSLAFVRGEIRNGVVTKDPVVEYIVYYDGEALDDKLVYNTAEVGNPPEAGFEDERISIAGKNKYKLYADNGIKPDGLAITFVITYKGLTTIATATLPNVRDGERGLQGLQGKDGRDGINGKDGTSSYTHIAYATDNKGGNFSQSPEGCDYIGMYVDSNPTDSTNPNDYRWTKFVGEDGRNGSDGTPGKPGKDGRTPYLHIAYANSSDGKQGFSVTKSSGRDYIGQYTDYSRPDSSDPARYTWSRIKGEKGEQGEDGAPGHSLTLSFSSPSECRNGKVKDGEIHFDWDLYYDGQVVPRNDDLRGRVVIWSDQKTRREEVSESQILDEGIYFVGRLDLSRGLTLYLKASYKGLVATASTFVPNVVDGKDGAPGKPGKDGTPGKDGHALTASLIVEGEVADGQLYQYHMHPSFFYDGREVTEEIGDSFYSRCNLNENGSEWCPWEPHDSSIEDFDLTDSYTGPGVSFEVKATYKGLTVVASAFVPHVITPKKLKEIETGLSSATTLVSTVEEIKENYMDRDQWSDMIIGTHDALEPLVNALKSPDGTQVAGGLLLSKFIALSNQLDKITSYISGMDGGGRAMLAAGVEHFGTPEEDAVSRINYDGTVKFGEIYGNKSYVDFGKPAVLRVGKDVIRDSIEEVFRHNVVEKSVTLSLSVESPTYLDEKSIYIDHDKSSVTFEGQVECGQMGGQLNDRFEIVLTSRDGFDIYSRVIPIILMGDNVRMTFQFSSTVFLDKGYHSIGLLVRTDIAKYKASISSLKVTQRWSSDLRQSAISQRGVRFWGGPGNYFDYNRSASGAVPAFTLGGGMVINGGLRTDTLTADRIICKSGGLYSGGVINKYGTVTRWVGRKITVSKVSTGRYKLTHYLGHINYVVQAIPVHSSDNNCFVIDGTETAYTVEVGVQWNGSWTNRAIHFVIYAQQ